MTATAREAWTPRYPVYGLTAATVSGHTEYDEQRLVAAGIDPMTVQCREHSVPCARCRRMTFNVKAVCTRCAEGGAS